MLRDELNDLTRGGAKRAADAKLAFTSRDLKREKPPRAELLGLQLGPTGNLRAPSLRKGRTLIVGFDEATYKRLLG